MNSRALLSPTSCAVTEKSLSENNNEWTVKRSLQNIIPAKNTIVCGDFNSHYSWWNSAVSDSDSKKAANLVK